MNKIVVYDFDKTLTYKDTLFSFFRHAAPKNFTYPFKLSIYFGFMVAAKIGLLSNFKLKDRGVKLFLKGMDQNLFYEKCQSFADKIVCNQLYTQLRKENEFCYIVTASFEEYVQVLFPDSVKVIGSKIQFHEQKVETLFSNCYASLKVDALESEGIEYIDIFYTDSFSDFALANISKKICIVNGDSVIECSDIKAFKKYFNK